MLYACVFVSAFTDEDIQGNNDLSRPYDYSVSGEYVLTAV